MANDNLWNMNPVAENENIQFGRSKDGFVLNEMEPLLEALAISNFTDEQFREEWYDAVRNQIQFRLDGDKRKVDIQYIPFGLANLGDRTVNYTNRKQSGMYCAGVGRFQFFFHMLRLLPREFFRRERKKVKMYSVRVLYQDISVLPDQYYGLGLQLNFGTTQADGIELREPYDDTSWPYSIFDGTLEPHNVNENLIIQTTDTPLIRMGREESTDEFVTRLKKDALDSLPAGHDSRAQNGILRIMNCFLVEYSVYGERGGAKPEGFSHSSHIRYSPFVTDGTCFWFCLLYAITIRKKMWEHYAQFEWNKEFDVYSDMLSEYLNMGSHRDTKMKKIWKGGFQKYIQDTFHLEEQDLLFVHSSRIMEYVRYFGWSDDTFVLLGEDKEVLMGSINDIEKKNHFHGGLTMSLEINHYVVVNSFTGYLNVLRCPYCENAVFQTKRTLEVHMTNRTCLTCECKKSLPKSERFFKDYDEFKHHKDNLREECPVYNGDFHELVIKDMEETKRLKKRFRNDVSEKETRYKSKKKRQEEETEFFDSFFGVREFNEDEAIFFDLEAIVPDNTGVCKRENYEPQQAYAAGWIKMSELDSKRVDIAYGPDCIHDFMCFLDGYREEIVRDMKERMEMNLWNCVSIDPIPKKSGGHENRAYQIKAKWKSLDAVSCPVCDAYFEDHGVKEKHGEITPTSRCSIIYLSNSICEKWISFYKEGLSPRVSIFAHNGGKYDWVFIHRYLMETNRVDQIRCIRNGGRYIEMTYRDIFVFKDSMSFLSGSLDSIAKNFQVETMKGLFPYSLLKNMNEIRDMYAGEAFVREHVKIEYFVETQTLPGIQGMKVRRGISEEKYVELMNALEWVYSVEHETRKYLTDDVLCLGQIVVKFRTGWKSLPRSPELLQFSTIGQMCHAYFMRHYMPQGVYGCLDICEDDYIRRGVYGGRTEVFRRLAPAKKIHYLDVNSLYPHVMETYNMPCGDPTWHFLDSELDDQYRQIAASSCIRVVEVFNVYLMMEMLIQINAGNLGFLGYFTVDMECDPNQDFPVLPERVLTSGTFKNIFANTRKVKKTYYSEEILFAVRRGCRVTKVYSFCAFQSINVYGNFIGELKKQKLLGEGKDEFGVEIPGMAKNKSLREAAKLGMNSAYGKTLQKIDSTSTVINTNEALWNIVKDDKVSCTIQPIFKSKFSDVVEVTAKDIKGRIQKKSNAAIGGAILAHARMVLYQYFESVKEVGGEILYCDTDSIIYAGENPLPDALLHSSRFGAMKVEIDPDDICVGGFVAVCSKSYALKLKDGSPYVKCKGISLASNIVLNESVDMSDLFDMLEQSDDDHSSEGEDENEKIGEGLSFDLMKRLILGDVKKLVTSNMQFFRSVSRQVSMLYTKKTMEGSFDKRKLLMDGMTTPWNDFNRPFKILDKDEDDSVKKFNVRIISDFMKFGASEDVCHFMLSRLNDVWWRGLFESFFRSETESCYIRGCIESFEYYDRLKCLLP